MKVGSKTVTLLGFLIISYIVGLLIFTKGFLLVRTMIDQNSSCEADFVARADDLVHGGHYGCWSHARFKRAIIIIIDALRYDFLAYNTSLKSDVPPYKNKLQTVYNMLTKQPQNALMYKFIADPPTTTLQRLKGLTTGSLPTFVDAGANFGSSEIKEDNWVDQLIKQEKTVKFLGDDTWDSLFPNRFYKSFPFPSFNVKDLHTVDNGILKHLYPEIRRRDWDVVIAHFLGVDHCGHRFGPNHPAMAEKLQQMDQVIRNVTRLMKGDTVLFVLGDHGMTRTGDHGGDSDDELSAGLFVYSPAQITAPSPSSEDKPKVVQQTDLVPTISLLLGVPIPFSNLGTIIPDLFTHCPWWETQANHIRQVFHRVKALHLNALQVSKYLSVYGSVSSDLPAHQLHQLQTILTQAETELQALVTSVTAGTGSPGLLERLQHLADRYNDYLAQVRDKCQEVWAKFDLTSMTLGVVMIAGCLVVNAVLAFCWTGDGEELPGCVPFMIGGIGLQVGYYLIHLAVFPPTVVPIMGYVLGGVLIFAGGVVLRNRVAEAWTDGGATDVCVASGVVVLYFMALFSNSYVVYEDAVTHFFCQSLLWYTSLRAIIGTCRTSSDHQTGKDNASRWSKKSRQTFVDILERLTQPAAVTFFVTVVCSILLRCSAAFRACREEQWNCEVSSFLQPLSSFAEDATGYKNQRYFFSVACVFATLWLARRWLQHYGNLNGDGLNILCTKFLLPSAAIACALYWAVQALPQKDLDVLPPWQQTIMAQVVYACIIVHAIVSFLQPLYVYIHASSPKQLSVPLVNCGAEQTVPHVYRQLQRLWRREDGSDRPPAAYGLGTVYSSHLVVVAMVLYLLLVLLLGDGVSPALGLALAVFFLFLEITAVYGSETSGNSVPDGPVPWLAVATHGLLSSAFFFATGHQATIPNIRFEVAFTGFHGDFSSHAIPALLITLNTYAAPVLFGAVWPLMAVWPQLRGPVWRWMGGGGGKGRGGRKEEGTGEGEWRGDFALFDDGVLLRKNLFVSVCRVLLFQGVKVLGTACAAGILRRHLMVWKIFAPRFIFEAVGLIVVSTTLLVMMLVVLRVDSRLAKLTHSLQKQS